MKRLLSVLICVVFATISFSCVDDDARLDREKNEDFFRQSLAGKCDDKVNGETFTYSWLREVAAAGEVSWLTKETVNCVAEEALAAPETFVKGGCILAQAFVDLGEACKFDIFKDAVCPEGMRRVGGGICRTKDGTEMCLDGSSPVDGKCPFATAGGFGNLCNDGSTPKDGVCPDTKGGGGIQTGSGVEICKDCFLAVKVRWPTNYGGQIYVDLRPYFNVNSAIAKGELFTRFCKDEACKNPIYLTKIAEVNVPLTGKVYDFIVSGAPKGESYMQIIFDTKYSRDSGSACTDFNNCPGPFDVVSMKVEGNTNPADIKLTMNNNGDAGHNPPAGTFKVNVAGSGAVGTIFNIGSFVFDRSFYIDSPVDRSSYLLTASSGECYRNVVRAVDLEKYSVSETILKLNDVEFDGDICGFVPAEKGVVYALGYGHGKCGAYVFKLKTPIGQPTSVSQDGEPIFIPHLANTDSTQDVSKCSNYDVTELPHPCRGVFVDRGTKKFLYMVEFEGAGYLPDSSPYPIMGVDLGDGKFVEKGEVLEINKDVTKRAIRGITSDNNYVYVLQASWSGVNVDDADKVNKVWRFKINSNGTLSNDIAPIISEGTANFKCGKKDEKESDVANYPPAFEGYTVEVNGTKEGRLAIGNDTTISFYRITQNGAEKIGDVDVSAYGRQFTDFALSPDMKRLYAISTCNAQEMLKIKKGNTTATTNVDRQLVAVLNIDTAGIPIIMDTNRDFDGDGKPDGGVDVQFTNIKKNVLKWVPTATGQVPPVVYTGPEIAAGRTGLFLRGTGVQGCDNTLNDSGLGQVSDIGVFDLASGEGVTYRNYITWLNGAGKAASGGNLQAASYWGFDLEPSKDTLSTGGLLYVGEDMVWGTRGFAPAGGSINKIPMPEELFKDKKIPSKVLKNLRGNTM